MKEPLCKKGTATVTINAEPPKPTTFEDLGYVQVVRCKDCKHWEQSNGHCPFNSIFTNEDWFCADGEKKA